MHVRLVPKTWSVEDAGKTWTGVPGETIGQALVILGLHCDLNNFTTDEITEFVKHYLVAALWSSTYSTDDDPQGNHPKPIDDDYDVDDVAEESVYSAREDCLDFINECTKAGIDLKNTELFPQRSIEWSVIAQHGHDLWLTRNGHGAGFWDRGYGEVGDKVSNIARAMKECNIDVIGGKVVLS